MSIGASRLALLREKMTEKKLDGFVVRGTDRYLNEYVPTEESTRVWITGFTGSTGDALIFMDAAFLFVDGRYYLQADREADPRFWTVVKVPLGTSLLEALGQCIAEQSQGRPVKIGLETDRFSVKSFQSVQRLTESLDVDWVPVVPSLVEELRGPIQGVCEDIYGIGESLTGRSSPVKQHTVRTLMKTHRLNAFIIQKLDEIAYLTNLRGNEIPYQSTFRSIAIIKPEGCVLALPGGPERTVRDPSPGVQFIPEEDWVNEFQNAKPPMRVGFDPSTTTQWVKERIRERGADPVPVDSPIVPLKARKTPQEMGHMIESFAKADRVVEQARSWLCRKIHSGVRVTELDFSNRVEALFKRSGADRLSFKIISAAGQNGAVIHYSNPDPDREILAGELMLLDTGAYYEGGYATDLTRTFLVGGKGISADNRQKKIFTLVLKGAIAGMSARFPQGTKGASIDALVRAPLWAEGFDYNHGTGHGVGINVHEAPPTLSVHGNAVLETGHIFSIEPGIYLDGFGGVRIENLCTVVPDSRQAGWLAIIPLTFSPLDERLIDRTLLSRREKKWLRWYKKEARNTHRQPPIPPVI